MKILSFFARLFSLVTVNRCIACRATIARQDFMCSSCLRDYRQERLWECGICGRGLSECTCVNEYLEKAAVHRTVKLLRYQPNIPEAVGNRILYRLKRHRVFGIHRFLAAELSETVRRQILPNETYVVTHVVRNRRQKKKYGFDQSECLARALADALALPYVAALNREKKAHVQKKISGADARRENVKGAFSPAHGVTLRGKRVLLVDDIITTGASVAECARVLRRMGAREVIGVCAAISYRQPNIKYEHDVNSREKINNYLQMG